MQTMTSAYANKMLKSLEEDKVFWVNKEAASSTYVASINEEPVVPEYDYTEVAAIFMLEMMRMKNYWKMSDFSIFSVPYAYVDHSSYLADQLFVQNKVTIKFKGEMAKNDSPYRIVFCKVLKRDAERFEEALGRLKDKMLLLGHRDYPDACGEIAQMIEEGMEARKRR